MTAPNMLHHAHNPQDRLTQLAKLQEIMEFVRTSLAKAFTHQKKYYDLRRRDWTPQVGDIVARREHVLSSAADQFCAKLAPKYLGGLTVTRILNRVMSEVRDEQGKTYRVHVKDLRPWQTETPGPKIRDTAVPERTSVAVGKTGTTPEKSPRTSVAVGKAGTTPENSPRTSVAVGKTETTMENPQNPEVTTPKAGTTPSGRPLYWVRRTISAPKTSTALPRGQ